MVVEEKEEIRETEALYDKPVPCSSDPGSYGYLLQYPDSSFMAQCYVPA